VEARFSLQFSARAWPPVPLAARQPPSPAPTTVNRTLEIGFTWEPEMARLPLAGPYCFL
jgi:hypothetical protein